jgi:hypothetical protein
MPTTRLSRLGAVSGAVFAVGLFVATGDGSNAYSAPRAILGIGALTVAIPFVVYLGGILRAGGGSTRWLADLAVATGVTGIALKLSSTVPELATHKAGISHGTAAYVVLDALAGAATVIALYPLAVLCAATAIVALRTRCLPQWLAVGAGATALALAVNGAFLATDSVPAFLLFIIWTLATSAHLTRVAGRDQRAVATEFGPAAA